MKLRTLDTRGLCHLMGIGALLAATHAAAAQKPEALWYARGELSVQSFFAHADQISIISPQVFTLDKNGTIKGSVDRRIIDKAREKGVKLVPLLMNPGFDQPSIHRVLTERDVRHRAIRNIAAMCRENHFDGIQLDIENVHIADKDAFTSFVRESVDSVHQAGCTLSAAVVPRTGEDPGPTTYHKWIFENWRGVYDYKALADTLNFISYMTYAQHTGNSPAGPVAGYPWMVECLEYLLSLGVPSSKISLGVAAYSDWWFPAWDAKAGPRMRGSDIPFARAESVLARSGAHAEWDDVQKSLFASWDEHGVYQHAWMEDARAFVTKMGLVSKYTLRGYSVWLLGSEDARTWAAIGPVAK
jgi:spore germination protein YaaH